MVLAIPAFGFKSIADIVPKGGRLQGTPNADCIMSILLQRTDLQIVGVLFP